jgi:preprotein translocase subunit SecF
MSIPTLPFMRFRKHALIISVVLMLASVVSLAIKGLNYGLDFTGGVQIELLYSESPDLDGIRSSLTEAGYPNHEVVFFGTDKDVLIRLQDSESSGEEQATQTAETVIRILGSTTDSTVSLKRREIVGSQVGAELREQGGLGMLVALGMIMLYIALRFQFKFAVGAVASLAHDVLLTLAFFSITGLSFDLTVLAAVLAVIGYSLNDTIVVADRIRENFRILRGTEPAEVIDIAVTQTLIRTTITSLTTLLVLSSLYFFGGQVVEGFSVALIFGVIVGTYSSIYVASSTLMFMNITKEDLMPPVRDKEELDALP